MQRTLRSLSCETFQRINFKCDYYYSISFSTWPNEIFSVFSLFYYTTTIAMDQTHRARECQGAQTFMSENQKNMFHLLKSKPVNGRERGRARKQTCTQKNKSIIALKRETLFIRCVRLFIFTLSSSSSSSLSPIWSHCVLFGTVRAERANQGKRGGSSGEE